MLDFDPFTRHAAYCLWRLDPNKISGKKLLKVPVHYDGITKHSLPRAARGSSPALPGNPAPPLTHAEAMQWVAYNRSVGRGHDRPGEVGYIGLGFRPEGTTLACLDIDDCLQADGQWAPHALAMIARFPGALLELSHSGRGLHIWFSYSGTSPGKHGKDATGLYELYGGGQFIAAGTAYPGGSALVDHTVAMHQVLAEFWPVRQEGAKQVTANDWAEKTDEQKERTKQQILDACRVVVGDNTYGYHQWVEIGMALASLGDEGNALWHEVSSWHPDYDFDNTEHRWAYLHPDRTDYRAMFSKAQQQGWVNPESNEAKINQAMARLADGFDFDEPEAYGFTSSPTPHPRLAPSPTATQRYPDTSGATDVVAREVPAPVPPPPATPLFESVSFGLNTPFVAPAGFTPPPDAGAYRGTAQFDETVPAVSVVLELDAAPKMNFVESTGDGAKANLPNIVKAIQGHESNVRVRYDEFLGRIVIGKKNKKGRPLKDADSVRLRLNLERGGFKAIGKELMDSALLYLADEDRYDSAIEWGRELQWDGTKRVTMALHRYYGVEDTPYTRACSEYLFTALAGRCMSPGCQADMALIFVGLQGARKTSAVSALAPMPDSFVSLNLGGRDDDTARRLRGKLVGELGEMRGRGERDVQSIREWITRRFESWVEKFEKFETKFPRRLVMIATVNEHEVLDDPEGERRWLPMMVGFVDVEALEADRDQLWAEGIAMWNEGGVRWQEAERLARAEHHIYKVHDEYIEKIETWLAEVAVAKPGMIGGGENITGEPRGNAPFTISDVLLHCIGVPTDRHDNLWQKKVGKILRGLKYEKKVMRVDGLVVKRWVKVTA